MFRKLLSNLPFTPSLITQVSFYAKRLQRESSIRKAGLIFISLTLAVQTFAVISPAEASNQCSSNDVVRCGFKTRAEAVQQCNNNTSGFRTILEYYGVNCNTIANAATQTVRSDAHGGKLFSMGRNPYNKPGEYPVSIPGAGTFYYRPVSSWGKTSHKMLVMKMPDGKPLMIIYDCANIVIEQGYKPPEKQEPPSKLKLVKTNEPTSAVKPGDVIKYTIVFSNTGGTSAFFSVNDTLSDGLEYVDSQYGGWIFERKGQSLKWYNNTPPFYTFGNTDVFGTPGFITVRARVKSNVSNGSTVCNTAYLEDIHTQTKKIQHTDKVTVCNKVAIPCPSGTIPQPDGSCKQPEPEPEKKEPLLAIEKTASNITQKIEDADNTTAAGGDIIEYSLITKNFGEGEAKGTILQPEQLADVLEYADLDFNTLGDAVFDQDTQSVAWNKPVNIKPGESVIKKFRVRIKDPIPQTPSPHASPGSYDLVLTNVYGNTINIKLPGGVAKTTEQVVHTLPKTGPGESLVIGGGIVTTVGYFFARSRLMARELEFVKQEYASGN